MARKKRKWLRRLGIALAILIAYGLYAHWPVEYKITVSPETTYLTGPLRPDGTVNYLAALNQQLSDGVTPENNAAVLLFRAIGPAEMDEIALPRWLAGLGIEVLPAEGDYLVRFSEFLEDREDLASTPDPDEDETPMDRLGRAMESPWKTEDFPDIAAWLDAIDRPLALAVEASGRPRHYIPLVATDARESMIGLAYPPLPLIVGLANGLGARAMKKLGDGDVEGCRRDLLACHRLARLLGQGVTLVDRLIMIAIDAGASVGASGAATSGLLSATDAQALLAALQELPALPRLADAFDQCERLSGLDAFTQVSQGMPIGTVDDSVDTLTWVADLLPIDWDVLLRMLNESYDRIGECLRMPHAGREEACQRFAEDAMDVRKDRAGNVIMTILYGLGGRPFRRKFTRDVSFAMLAMITPLVLPTLNRAVELHDEARTELELAKLALALVVFKAETGAYPADLNALTPKYVPEIPLDIFSLEPLIYRRAEKGYLLYSIGCNMIDDDGKRDRKSGEPGAADDRNVKAER